MHRSLSTLLLLTTPALLVAQVPAVQIEQRIARVERGLLPAVITKGGSAGMPIRERMLRYRVPGVSIAVINGGVVEWARGYGVRETGGPAVDTATVFQAASISKPVAAIAALRAVQDGRLSLDEDVNRKLTSWKLPESDFTSDKKVTLRGLLSHTAGLTVHGFRGYAASEAVPSASQLLDGTAPANSKAVRTDVVPGSIYRYSGGGYTVMQLLVSDVLGRPFPEIVRATVLEPLGMGRSAYEQPLTASRARNAAVGYRGNSSSVTGRWHTYPELAAAGLWTTPSDLARFAIEIQRSLRGESNRVLSQQMTRQALTVVKDGYGLGLGIAGEGRSTRFSHGGANEGFRCMLIAFNETGQGVVVMTNSDLGSPLASEIIRAVAREYGWPSNQPTERPLIVVDPARLAAYAGEYRVDQPGGRFTIGVTVEGGRLLVQPPGQGSDPTVALSDTSFALQGDGTEVIFVRAADGTVEQVIIAPQSQRFVGHRVKR